MILFVKKQHIALLKWNDLFSTTPHHFPFTNLLIWMKFKHKNEDQIPIRHASSLYACKYINKCTKPWKPCNPAFINPA